MSRATASGLRTVWEKNYVANRAAMTEREPPLIPLPTERLRPVLCVGAGPSLNKNIDDIDPDRYEVISCDKSAGRLVQAGHRVDYIVALNAAHTDVEKWLEPAHGCGATLVVPAGVHPEAWQGWPGKVMFLNAVTSTGLENRVLRETGYYPLVIGSNAGTFTYLLAYYLGCNPIAYIGMDFSFLSKEEVERRFKDAPETYNVVEMCDSEGERRWTALGWVFMADSFQEHVRVANMRGVTTYACTQGGINYSEYTHVCTLAEFNKAVGPRRT